MSECLKASLHLILEKMSKKGRPTDEELLASLGELGEPTSSTAATQSSQPIQTEDTDFLERELGLPERARPTSRPHTPRGGSTAPATTTSRSSPKPTATGIPVLNDGPRNSEEKNQQRKSGDSARSFHTSFTPASTEADSPPEKASEPAPAPESPVKSSGGGWWGALSATASAAVKQAEALAKEIQHNEEAQRWATQVKGNVGALRGLGTQDLASAFSQAQYLSNSQ